MRKLAAVALLALFVAPALSACTKTVDEMSYSEVKEYAAEMHKKCLAQGVKDGPEMQLCINQEARADQSRRIRQRQIAHSTTYCQSFGSNVVCF